MLARMYKKRLAGYSALGYIVAEGFRPGYQDPECPHLSNKYLSLANEMKRLYSFVRGFLTKRWFCDANANQTQ
jgi:hypothetical protein